MLHVLFQHVCVVQLLFPIDTNAVVTLTHLCQHLERTQPTHLQLVVLWRPLEQNFTSWFKAAFHSLPVKLLSVARSRSGQISLSQTHISCKLFFKSVTYTAVVLTAS